MVPGRLARSARLLASGRSVLGAEGDLLPLVHLLVAAWAVVAGTSLLASLAGLRLFDIGEPLVRLTAVHYLYAGVGALTIAGRVAASGAIWPRLASVAVVATATAPPLVAGGFVTRHPVLQIGGAVVMTIGVWSTAVLLLFGVSRAVGGPARLFRLAAGVTPWVPMVLAVAWATAQHVVGAPALSVRDMARLHGLANGIGFVLAGLLATNTVHLARPVRQDGPA